MDNQQSRKRGRPRKHPKPEVKSSVADTDVMDIEEIKEDVIEHPEEINDDSNYDAEKLPPEETIEVNELDDADEVIKEYDVPNSKDLVQNLKGLGLSDDELSDDKPTRSFQPLKKNVIKRGYEGGEVQNTNTEGFDDGEIASSQSGDGDIPSSAQTFTSDDVIAPPTSNPQPLKKDSGSVNSQAQSMSSFQKSDDELEADKKREREKRKNVRKTAEVFLTTYRHLFPQLFKWMAKYNMSKVNRAEMSDDIDLSMQISEDGTSVGEYIDDHNDNCDETFEFTETQIDEIREPLIDVMLEKGFELTPMQRLIFAMGGQAVAMGSAAVKLAVQKSQDMAQFKTFHDENKASGYAKPKRDRPPPRHSQPEVKVTPEKTSAPTKEEKTSAPPKTSAPIIKDDEIEDIPMDVVSNTSKKEDEKPLTMDNYIDGADDIEEVK